MKKIKKVINKINIIILGILISLGFSFYLTAVLLQISNDIIDIYLIINKIPYSVSDFKKYNDDQIKYYCDKALTLKAINNKKLSEYCSSMIRYYDNENLYGNMKYEQIYIIIFMIMISITLLKYFHVFLFKNEIKQKRRKEI